MARTKNSDILKGFVRIKEPDTSLLAELAKKACGKRTNAEFAELCGVNPSTMHRLINGKNVGAPTDDLVVAVAVNADPESGVTLKDMLDAHGVAPADAEKFSRRGSVESVIESRYRDMRAAQRIQAYYDKLREVDFEGSIREIVQNDLISRGYWVSQVKEQEIMQGIGFPYIADFVLGTNALESEKLDKWAFTVSKEIGARVSNSFNAVGSSAYWDSPSAKGYRVTVITLDENSYLQMKRELEGLDPIHDSISLMLVDVQVRKVVAEYVIDRSDGGMADNETAPDNGTVSGIRVVPDNKIMTARIFDEGTPSSEVDWQEIYGTPDD